MSVSPEDFFSSSPPPRIIGVECEYNLQAKEGTSTSILTSKNMKGVGVNCHGSFLGSQFGSGRAYSEFQHLEFDTAESMGPASAAVEDINGIERISEIVNRSKFKHTGIFRISGSFERQYSEADEPDAVNPANNYKVNTSGYHENYLLPRRITRHRLIETLLPSMLASRVWAMNGTLSPNGYVLSQKVWGIGGDPVARGTARRTDPGNKPMVLIPSIDMDYDTTGDDDWARVEVRFADPGLSLVNRYLSFSAVSLTLRLIEHADEIGDDQLNSACLIYPVRAAKRYAADPRLATVAPTKNKQMFKALDVQERFFELFSTLSEKVELPDDEKLAIVALGGLIEALRASVPQDGVYTPLARSRIDFAAKHLYILKRKLDGPVKATSPIAMQRNLVWDMVLPEGPGYEYWKAVSMRDPLAAEVIRFAGQSGGIAGRAKQRAKIIDSPDYKTVRNWSTYSDDDGSPVSLGSPYGQ